MRYHRVVSIVAVSFLLCGASREAAASGPKVWFVDSLVKVFPSDIAGSHRLAKPQLLAARCQHVSVQMAVRSARALPAVTAAVGTLKGVSGETLAGASVRPVGYVVVASHSRNTPEDERIGEAPGWFPDPLQDFPVDIPANRTQALWVEVAVPAGAPPGDYHGAVTVRTGDRLLARREIRVKVLSASVPAGHTLKVTNWFTVDARVSRQFYGLKQFTPEWWALIGNIARVMAEHRQNMVLTPLLALVEPRVEGDRLAYDFSNFDRWVETFRSAGAMDYIEGSHLLSREGGYDDGLTVANTFQIESGKATKQKLPADDQRVDRFLVSFLTALNAHLEEKGWKSIYYQHVLDEAHGKEPPYYARCAKLVHQYLPGVPTTDAVDAAHIPEELQEYCDIWVPQLGRFDSQMEMIRQRMANGHEVWFYTCLFPTKRYLNRLIDYPLLKVRLLHWMNFRYELPGFLHWGWNYWTPDPIQDTQPVLANVTILPPGDAFIVYPDRARKSVYSSIRLETMLQGIEDYEMLQALKAKDPAAAARLGEEAIAGFTDYVRDPAKFRGIEKELLETLAK
ncbi:MAG: DUF4091 domain-containing protein [Bryobacteraceae bacterium]|nr:DUF4091 domain-containing protein [Bryobacteraceae bacterium]